MLIEGRVEGSNMWYLAMGLWVNGGKKSLGVNGYLAICDPTSSQGPVGIDQCWISLQIALQETWPTPKLQPVGPRLE